MCPEAAPFIPGNSAHQILAGEHESGHYNLGGVLRPHATTFVPGVKAHVVNHPLEVQVSTKPVLCGEVRSMMRPDATIFVPGRSVHDAPQSALSLPCARCNHPSDNVSYTKHPELELRLEASTFTPGLSAHFLASELVLEHHEADGVNE